MKRTLDEAQFLELRKLGYMKDHSLAGLIEFLYEDTGMGMDWPSLLRFHYDGKSIAYKGTAMLLDDLYEAVVEYFKIT